MITPAETREPPFFSGFQRLDVTAGDVKFAGVIGGQGPSVLLLHGYPQTHIAWRWIAPVLSEKYTVIVPDLPGYGDSQTLNEETRWTKRRVASSLVQLMHALGHERFALAGHDRGARVAYRLALDHPAKVSALASLAVVPTLDAMATIDYRAASRAFHWFFLSQETDLPERLLAADPDAFIGSALMYMMGGRDILEPEALDAYRNAFRKPTVRHAMCEDYRSALKEDLELDIADRDVGKAIACPVLALWPAADWAPERPVPTTIWRQWATDVSGVPTSGGHLQMEDAPQEVLSALLPFLTAHTYSEKELCALPRQLSQF